MVKMVPVSEVAGFLQEHHYLGPAKRGFALRFDDGCMVLSNPSSRRLPADRWLELTRWCIVGEKNAGSRQWAEAVRFLRGRGAVTTVVSYSDPAQGHTGALYRACNWRWAPTWHRLRPPPTGNGAWTEGKGQAVKDRWVYPLAPDLERAALLAVQDAGLKRRMPWAEFVEARKGLGGGDFGRFKREVLLGGAP